MVAKLKQLKVEEYTSPDPITVTPETPLDRVLALLRENNVRHLPVVEGNKAVGIISDRDVLMVQVIDTVSLTARDVMTPDPVTYQTTDSLEVVAFELSKRKISSAIINDEDGSLYGVFTSTDALNALVEVLRDSE
jgi:acetoin utilization protein AcuB